MVGKVFVSIVESPVISDRVAPSLRKGILIRAMGKVEERKVEKE